VSVAGWYVAASHALSYAFATRVKKNRPLFAAVWWWGCQTASLRCEAPFLHVGFDEDEPHLAEVDMHLTRSVCADCRKEVLRFETVSNILEFLPVACEEERSGSWSVPNADNISLHIGWGVGGRYEWLVVAAVSVGHV